MTAFLAMWPACEPQISARPAGHVSSSTRGVRLRIINRINEDFKLELTECDAFRTRDGSHLARKEIIGNFPEAKAFRGDAFVDSSDLTSFQVCHRVWLHCVAAKSVHRLPSFKTREKKRFWLDVWKHEEKKTT
jgi:hypothetical protein